MVEEEYIDEELEEDNLEDSLEKQHEIQSDLVEGDTTPSYGPKDDLWTLFKWTVAKRDSSKLGNLDTKELGLLNISVRDFQRIALIANVLGHEGFARFFNSQGEIVLATSASKKGWQQELFVSQRKYGIKTKTEGQTQNLLNQQPQKKKGFFDRFRRN